MFFSLHFNKYLSLEAVLDAIITLDGIAPELFFVKASELILCSDGLSPLLYVPLSSSFCICELYSCNTLALFALGFGVFDSHQIRVKESLTLTRRLLTHSVGPGSFAGL